MYNNSKETPVQPNGLPYSKEDFLALSKEYQEERNKIIRTNNTKDCLFVIIGIILAGIAMPVMIGAQNVVVGLLFLVAGAIILIFGGLTKPKGDKRIVELQEKYYSDYIKRMNK